MEELKYQGFSAEYTQDGKMLSYVYRGTRSEMETLVSGHHVGESAAAGRLKSVRISPREGPMWECELRYEAPEEWQSIAAPDRSWGVRSCQLRGVMLSRPLAAHPGYRANWDNSLAAAPGVSAVPGWWSGATEPVVPAADRSEYRWCRGSGGLSDGWSVLKGPTKPGAASFDTAAYSITETARFRSASAAGKMVSRVLNRVGVPATAFGITGGNWKCDDAEISWNGSFWLAKLSWTHNENGWDVDLYGDD